MHGHDDFIRMDAKDALDLAVRALLACGANDSQAFAMARAALDADAHGHHGQGLDHLAPYCDGLLQGRIDGQAEPVIETVTPVMFHVDAKAGSAHLAYERTLPQVIAAVREFGLAVYSCANSYTCGELGWFVRQLLNAGLGGIAATNGGPALLAAAGSTKPVFCTNPLAFGMPAGDQALLIDQSSSSTAFTNIRIAASKEGATIPLGWALDANGDPTTDPKAALHGVLLAFGGARGANMALMVETLSAGLSGANWSLDAPAFHQGDACPKVGQFVLAIDPKRLAGKDFEDRLSIYLTRLRSQFGVHIPGARKFETLAQSGINGVAIPKSAAARLQSFIDLNR